MKSLFRRSQALRGLGRLDRAASDLQRCVRLEPKNKTFQEALRDLGSSAQEKVGPGPLRSCCPSGFGDGPVPCRAGALGFLKIRL